MKQPMRCAVVCVICCIAQVVFAVTAYSQESDRRSAETIWAEALLTVAAKLWPSNVVSDIDADTEKMLRKEFLLAISRAKGPLRAQIRISMADSLAHGDERLGMLSAAMEEDKTLLAGWYRLAIHDRLSESIDAVRAREELVRLYPTNALGYYLKSMFASTEDMNQLLASCEEGNRQPSLIYPSPLVPMPDGVRYPKIEPYISLDMDGKPVPGFVLTNITMNIWPRNYEDTILISMRLRNLHRSLINEGDSLLQKAKIAEAMRFHRASRDLGLHLAHGKSVPTTFYIMGAAIAKKACERLEADFDVFPSGGTNELLEIRKLKNDIDGWRTNFVHEMKTSLQVLEGDPFFWLHSDLYSADYDAIRKSMEAHDDQRPEQRR